MLICCIGAEEIFAAGLKALSETLVGSRNGQGIGPARQVGSGNGWFRGEQAGWHVNCAVPKSRIIMAEADKTG